MSETVTGYEERGEPRRPKTTPTPGTTEIEEFKTRVVRDGIALVCLSPVVTLTLESTHGGASRCHRLRVCEPRDARLLRAGGVAEGAAARAGPAAEPGDCAGRGGGRAHGEESRLVPRCPRGGEAAAANLDDGKGDGFRQHHHLRRRGRGRGPAKSLAEHGRSEMDATATTKHGVAVDGWQRRRRWRRRSYNRRRKGYAGVTPWANTQRRRRERGGTTRSGCEVGHRVHGRHGCGQSAPAREINGHVAENRV